MARKYLFPNLAWSSYLLWCFLFLSIVGCSRAQIDPNVSLKTVADFEKAKDFVVNRDYASAIPILSKCTESGAIQSQLLGEVLGVRAIAYIHTGDLEKALQDIEGLESIEGGTAMVHGLKYFYWQKSGNVSKAQLELSLARRIDPNFKSPE